MSRLKVLFLFGMVIVVLAAPTLLLGVGTARAASTIARGKWSIVTSLSPGAKGNDLAGVAALSANDVWATGTALNGNAQMLIEHWNGSAWNLVSSPEPPDHFIDLLGITAVTSNDIWTVGNYYTSGSFLPKTLTEHWNGTSWNYVSSPDPSSYIDELSGVSADATNDAWAVGAFNNMMESQQTLIEHWNGTAWSIVPSPNVGADGNVLSSVITISPNDAWTVGYYTDSMGYQKALIEHWDGSSWSVVANPSPDSNYYALRGISAVSANDIWAVGDFQKIHGRDNNLIEHWNGTQWEIVLSPRPGNYFNSLASVSALSANDVWTVGTLSNNSGSVQTFIEHWNGKAWHAASSPNVGSDDNLLGGVAVVPGTSEVWAVGEYDNSSFINQTLIECYCT